MKYIKIIDNYDGQEVYTIKTDFTIEELEKILLELAEKYNGEWGYEDLLIKIGEKYPKKHLEVLDIEGEIYI